MAIFMSILPATRSSDRRQLVPGESVRASLVLLARRGIQGATGAVGAAGPQGLTGATGAQGVQGLTGATGASGATGSQGIAGVAGAAGADGKSLLNGIVNPTSATGLNGEYLH